MNLTNAKEIVRYAYEANIKLMAKNGNLVVNTPKGQISPELRASLAKHKQAILEVLTYHGFTLDELQRKAEEDWNYLKDDQAALITFAQILHEQALMRSGKIPARFTATTFCISCNRQVRMPPALANGGRILGCPHCTVRSNTVSRGN